MKSGRRALPRSTFAYARERLWLAGGLEGVLASVLQDSSFDAWTIADGMVTDSRLQALERGGLDGRDVASDVGREAARVMERIGESSLVVPDSLAKPGDAFLGGNRTDDIVIVGGGVYYVGRSANQEELEATWRKASSSAGQLGLVTSRSLAPAASEDDLRSAGEHAELIVLTAYDGEGAVYFERRFT